MLRNIKSSYFIKKIFSYLNESSKLKLIKYNKKLQANLGIKLLNYKIYGGKYIIYENNTKGKEYDGRDDTLLFEGEFINPLTSQVDDVSLFTYPYLVLGLFTRRS